eukprot:577003-Pelagomonas_calceolata.AAC.1
MHSPQCFTAAGVCALGPAPDGAVPHGCAAGPECQDLATEPCHAVGTSVCAISSRGPPAQGSPVPSRSMVHQ